MDHEICVNNGRRFLFSMASCYYAENRDLRSPWLQATDASCEAHLGGVEDACAPQGDIAGKGACLPPSEARLLDLCQPGMAGVPLVTFDWEGDTEAQYLEGLWVLGAKAGDAREKTYCRHRPLRPDEEAYLRRCYPGDRVFWNKDWDIVHLLSTLDVARMGHAAQLARIAALERERDEARQQSQFFASVVETLVPFVGQEVSADAAAAVAKMARKQATMRDAALAILKEQDRGGGGPVEGQAENAERLYPVLSLCRLIVEET